MPMVNYNGESARSFVEPDTRSWDLWETLSIRAGALSVELLYLHEYEEGDNRNPS